MALWTGSAVRHSSSRNSTGKMGTPGPLLRSRKRQVSVENTTEKKAGTDRLWLSNVRL